MQRVLIVGPGGAGKSWLAKRIAARTGVPLVHLDRGFWQPGWVDNYGGTLSLRMERAALRSRSSPRAWRNTLHRIAARRRTVSWRQCFEGLTTRT